MRGAYCARERKKESESESEETRPTRPAPPARLTAHSLTGPLSLLFLSVAPGWLPILGHGIGFKMREAQMLHWVRHAV